MKSITADIMFLSASIKNLSQVTASEHMINVVNRGHIVQLQNELDIKLEQLRKSNKAPMP